MVFHTPLYGRPARPSIVFLHHPPPRFDPRFSAPPPRFRMGPPRFPPPRSPRFRGTPPPRFFAWAKGSKSCTIFCLICLRLQETWNTWKTLSRFDIVILHQTYSEKTFCIAVSVKHIESLLFGFGAPGRQFEFCELQRILSVFSWKHWATFLSWEMFETQERQILCNSQIGCCWFT